MSARLNVGVTSFYEQMEEYGSESVCPYASVGAQNHMRYCARHDYGYTLRLRRRWLTDPVGRHLNRHPYLGVLDSVIADLPMHDWLAQVELDCLFMAIDVPLEQKIGDGGFDIGTVFHEDGVGRYFQGGVILFRNSEWTRDFLVRWRFTCEPNGNPANVFDEMLRKDTSMGGHIRAFTRQELNQQHVHWRGGGFACHCGGASPEEKLSILTSLAEAAR